MIYYRITNQIQTKHSDDGTVLETIEEQIQRFEEEIGFLGKTREQSAMDFLRADMIRRGLDPDALPDVELKQDWFKEDDFGDNWAAFQSKKRLDDKTEIIEDAGLDIEY